MKKENILYGIISILSIALLFMVLKNIGNYTSNTDEVYEEENVAFKSLKTPVEVQLIKKQSLIQTITANGVVKAQREAEIISQVSGRILQLNYHEGDYVHKDSVILRIDDELYQIAYLKAKEQVNKALAEYGIMVLGEDGTSDNKDNTDQLVYQEPNMNPGNINDREAFELLRGDTRKEMLANRVGLSSARLDLQRAELDLRNTVIRAPFDGFIGAMDLLQDGQVKTGELIMKIIDLNKLYVEVGILETEIQFIRNGAVANIEIPALPGESFKGTVKTISPILNSESGTCRIRIEMDNRKQIIKLGMFANVTISTQEFKERLLIPRDALLSRDERKVTFVYEKGRAKWHYVETGLENDDYFEIVEGLSDGDSLITSGHFNLAHDALVEIVEKE